MLWTLVAMPWLLAFSIARQIDQFAGHCTQHASLFCTSSHELIQGPLMKWTEHFTVYNFMKCPYGWTIYCSTCAIITHSLYISNPFFECQKCLLKCFFFLKILALNMVSIQELFLINSKLWWHTHMARYIFWRVKLFRINFLKYY